jgi:hypothetical protein
MKKGKTNMLKQIEGKNAAGQPVKRCLRPMLPGIS